MSTKFMTPTEIWENFDPTRDALENSIISQEDSNNIICSKQFFTSVFPSGESIRAYCEIYFDKRWADKRPVTVLIPPINKYDFRDVATTLVKEGYVVGIVDYCGNMIGDNKTQYPELLSFAKWPECKNNLTTLFGDAKHSVFYVWSIVVMRAISLIIENPVADSNKICVIGSGVGSEIGWIISGIDKRVSALVGINGGGYLWANDNTSVVPNIDESSAFSSGIGAETYAKMTNCPVLFIASSNSTYFDIDRSNDILSKVKNENKTFIISQGSDSQITSNAFKTMRAWLRDNFALSSSTPNSPELSFEKIEDKLFVRLKTTHRAKSRTVYVSYGEPYSYARSWEKLTDLQKTATHEYICAIPVNDLNDIVVAYATVNYDKDKEESTPIIKILPSKLNITPDVSFEDQTERIIYDGSMGLGTFTATTNSAILADDTLQVKEGPFEIKGISAIEGSLYLRHNANNLLSITKSGLLHIDIYSPKSKSLELVMYSYPKRKPYYASVNLDGGEFWQNVLLDPSDFKSEEGRPLQDFNDSKLFRIKDVAGLIFNNFLWI